MGKCGRAGHAADDNMAHAHCMLDNYGYRHTLYVIFIAFPRQQWLRERASVLHNTYIACLVWITKGTNTHPEYVISIAFPRQQWLRERASVLRYTYIACLVWITKGTNTHPEYVISIAFPR